MANLLEDIQCASFYTRPPMLDRTEFASCQQRIRLYCLGKENGVNILKSIDKGPFQMGTVWEPLAEETEGAPHLGPEDLESTLTFLLKKRIGHIARNFTQPKRSQYSDYYKDKMLLMQAQENKVALDEERLLFLADPVYDEARPSYDLDILLEVHDHDHYQDVVCEHHEEHPMHDNVQLNHVVDSHADYTSDSNMIMYDQYVKDNAVLELEAEVAQNAVDRQHDEIEWKNLLIVNDNLVAECLSKEVFYIVTNSELNVSRFTGMHVANTTVEARCLELEAELSNLRDKSHNDWERIR
nr:integrase, catalytic region, zinc finger, CCHC-type, peptidase aspartic, catalytic [Tanacetum cinerariifolium]GEZ38404.1 integrase, catalytic region, zinc finger, CCHC-type, peptidase aspartic, catalytic [Tanacetum cinerariifolium]